MTDVVASIDSAIQVVDKTMKENEIKRKSPKENKGAMWQEDESLINAVNGLKKTSEILANTTTKLVLAYKSNPSNAAMTKSIFDEIESQTNSVLKAYTTFSHIAMAAFLMDAGTLRIRGLLAHVKELVMTVQEGAAGLDKSTLLAGMIVQIKEEIDQIPNSNKVAYRRSILESCSQVKDTIREFVSYIHISNVASANTKNNDNIDTLSSDSHQAITPHTQATTTGIGSAGAGSDQGAAAEAGAKDTGMAAGTVTLTHAEDKTPLVVDLTNVKLRSGSSAKLELEEQASGKMSGGSGVGIGGGSGKDSKGSNSGKHGRKLSLDVEDTLSESIKAMGSPSSSSPPAPSPDRRFSPEKKAMLDSADLREMRDSDDFDGRFGGGSGEGDDGEDDEDAVRYSAVELPIVRDCVELMRFALDTMKAALGIITTVSDSTIAVGLHSVGLGMNPPKAHAVISTTPKPQRKKGAGGGLLGAALGPKGHSVTTSSSMRPAVDYHNSTTSTSSTARENILAGTQFHASDDIEVECQRWVAEVDLASKGILDLVTELGTELYPPLEPELVDTVVKEMYEGLYFELTHLISLLRKEAFFDHLTPEYAVLVANLSTTLKSTKATLSFAQQDDES